MNFSCPCAPLEFTQNKLLVPPQNLFLPPQSRYPGAGPAGVSIFVEHWGDNYNFTPILPYFEHWGGMNLDHDFVQVSKLNEDQEKNRFSPKMEQFFSRIQVKTKKRSSPKMEHFFPQIQVKTKKIGLHQRWNTFFPEFKWTPTLRCTPESN